MLDIEELLVKIVQSMYRNAQNFVQTIALPVMIS